MPIDIFVLFSMSGLILTRLVGIWSSDYLIAKAELRKSLNAQSNERLCNATTNILWVLLLSVYAGKNKQFCFSDFGRDKMLRQLGTNFPTSNSTMERINFVFHDFFSFPLFNSLKSELVCFLVTH